MLLLSITNRQNVLIQAKIYFSAKKYLEFEKKQVNLLCKLNKKSMPCKFLAAIKWTTYIYIYWNTCQKGRIFFNARVVSLCTEQKKINN